MLKLEISNMVKEIEDKLNNYINHGTLIVNYKYSQSIEGTEEDLSLDWYPKSRPKIKISLKVNDTRLNYDDLGGVLEDFTKATKEAKTEEDYRNAWPEKLYYVYNGYVTLEKVSIKGD